VRVVTPLERRRLLRQVIDGAATDGVLKHFQSVVGSAGLLDLADRTIARLKRGDVSPDDFAGSSTSPPRRELAELYGRYDACLLTAKLTDAEGLLLAARDMLRERADIEAGLELAVIDGFTDFSLVEWQILQQLVQRSKRTAVTLPGDGGALVPTDDQSTRRDLFARATITRQRLEEIGGVVVGPRPELAGGDKTPARSSSRKIDASTQSLGMPPAMVHLERNLFRDYGASERVTAAVKKSASCIQIVAASSEQAEIEEIARRVKELLVAGVRPGDVVVAFRSTSDVADRVRAAFADFGIPSHLDAPRKLVATPLVRSLASVLRLHAEDWPYRRVLQVLGDRSLRLSESDCDAAQSERTIAPLASRDATHRRAAELCVRHAQLPSGRESLLEQVKLWAEEAEPRPDCPEGVFALGGRVIERLAALLDELPEQAGIGQWLEALERLAARIALLGGKQVSGATPLPSPPSRGRSLEEKF
jgi:ATP-dependent helicase/DNAse subunit B